MRLVRRAPRKASDCTPEPEALPPTPDDKPCCRVELLVEGITLCEQNQLYAMLVQWDGCRYAGGVGYPSATG